MINFLLNVRFHDGTSVRREISSQHLLIGTSDYCDIKIPPYSAQHDDVLVTLLYQEGELFLNNSSQYPELAVQGKKVEKKTRLLPDVFIAIGPLATIQVEEITTIHMRHTESPMEIQLPCCDRSQKAAIQQVFLAAKRLLANNASPDSLKELLERECRPTDPHTLLMALDELFGLGPLTQLIQRNDITEIMVNSEDEIFIKQGGKILRTNLFYSGPDGLLQTCENILVPTGKTLSTSAPCIDARLKNGFRVNIVMPPVAIRGPVITIRCFPQTVPQLDDLVKNGTLPEKAAKFLLLCIKEKENIVISGGTDTGKTTLLNTLLNAIDEKERLIIIEEISELKIQHRHAVALETQLHGDDRERPEVTIRDLVRNALRMRPDRIIIGECRGGETLDMLQALNTGHQGSLTTIHANSPRDCLYRMETMALFCGVDLNPHLIRRQISRAIHLIVQVAHDEVGARRVTQIIELTGMEKETILSQDLYTLQTENGKKFLRPTGIIPKFVDELRNEQKAVDATLF